MQEIQDYKTINIDKTNWMNERNPVLTSFINGATGFPSNTTNDRKINAVVHALEHVYYARNLKLVTLLHFNAI